MYYDEMSREQLISLCRELKNKISDLENKVSKKDMEIDRLEWRIKTELEPRLKAERDSYDRWVTTPR